MGQSSFVLDGDNQAMVGRIRLASGTCLSLESRTPRDRLATIPRSQKREHEMKFWHIIPLVLLGYVLGAAFPVLYIKAKSAVTGAANAATS